VALLRMHRWVWARSNQSLRVKKEDKKRSNVRRVTRASRHRYTATCTLLAWPGNKNITHVSRQPNWLIDARQHAPSGHAHRRWLTSTRANHGCAHLPCIGVAVVPVMFTRVSCSCVFRELWVGVKTFRNLLSKSNSGYICWICLRSSVKNCFTLIPAPIQVIIDLGLYIPYVCLVSGCIEVGL